MNVSLSSKTAYLLVTHGSRDPRPAMAAQALAQRVASCLEQTLQNNSQPEGTLDEERLKAMSSVLVETACLELAPTPLHQQIVEFGDRALHLGYSTLMIVPLFLLPGVHVRDDIPAEVAIAQDIVHQISNRKMDLYICPYLGSAAAMVDVLAGRVWEVGKRGSRGVTEWDSDGVMEAGEVDEQGNTQNSKLKTQNSKLKTQNAPPHPTSSPHHSILLAHGSRRPGGNLPIEAIATQLEASPAYWSVSPGLENQIQRLFQQGYDRIMVIPYFLFAGGITDAIAQMVDEISDRHPHLTLILGQPLGAREDIARMITTLIEITQQNLIPSP